MVRHLTGKASPLKAASRKLATTTRIPDKAPIVSRPNLLRGRRVQSRPANRFLKSPSTLTTIYESPHEEDDDVNDSRYLHHTIDLLGREESRTSRYQESEDEDAEWDEETTLVAMLQDDHTKYDEEEEMTLLAEQIRAPMSAEGTKLRKYLAETVLPVVTKVKEVHGILEDQIDIAFSSGVLNFNEACKKMELMALQDEDEVKTAYINSQKNIKRLVAELREAYMRRDQLWATVETDLNTCAEQASAALEMLPSNVERTVAHVDKKCKELEKDASQANKQKILKGLLEKL